MGFSANSACAYTLVTTTVLNRRRYQFSVAVHMIKNEMGGACGAYGGGERGAQSSGGET